MENINELYSKIIDSKTEIKVRDVKVKEKYIRGVFKGEMMK